MPLKSIINRKQRYTLLKVLAMLSLVRWYNVLLLAIGLYLSSIFLLNPDTHWVETLKDYRLHLNVFSLSFYIMGGYIINAFYDLEKDLVNKPQTTIFDRIVSKRFSLNTYFLFNFIGTILAIFVGWKVLLFNSLLCFCLWFYSHKLRKKPFTSELAAAVLTIAPFASISLYYYETNLKIILYVGFIFALTLTREIIKKLVSLKGDVVYGDQSLPILFGTTKTKRLVATIMFLSLVPIGVLFSEIKDSPIFYFLLFSAVMVFTALILLIPAKEKVGFNRVNTVYKILLTLSIFAICLT